MAILFRLRLLGALALCLLIAAACGGGGGGSSASAPGVMPIPHESERDDQDDREPEDDGAGQAPAAIDDGAPANRDPQYYALVLSRKLDEVSLSLYEHGRFRKTEKETAPYYPRFYSIYSFDLWGLEAREGDRKLFDAYIGGGNYPWPSFDGDFSLTNPTSGSASWSGQVRAFETSQNDAYGTPVTGTARLRMDFSAARVVNGSHTGKVDVDFTNLTRGHANMSWRDVRVYRGTFRREGSVRRNGINMPERIFGSFFGNRHQGAAGTFDRNGLEGVFGVLRD